MRQKMIHGSSKSIRGFQWSQSILIGNAMTLDVKYKLACYHLVPCMPLVFKQRLNPKRSRLTTIQWKTQELNVHSTHMAELTPELGKYWYKIKMWHFIPHVPDSHFDIVLEQLSYFEDSSNEHIFIQGIEFLPLEMMQQEGFKTSEEKDIDEDTYWEKKLPHDYQHYVYMSNDYLHYTTKKELYFILCDGFLAYSGKLWFSLCKSTSGICSMLPASEILLSRNYDHQSLYTFSISESRFGEVKTLRARHK